MKALTPPTTSHFFRSVFPVLLSPLPTQTFSSAHIKWDRTLSLYHTFSSPHLLCSNKLWGFVLTVSSSSRASVSPVVLLKLLVLDEEREMFGLPPLHSFSLMNGLLRKTEGNRERERSWKWDVLQKTLTEELGKKQEFHLRSLSFDYTCVMTPYQTVSLRRT